MKKAASYQWKKLEQVMAIRSPWVGVFLERWRNEKKEVLDYWRVERPDSLIVIPLWRKMILMPPPIYRPGIQEVTWDLPGGRLLPGEDHYEAASRILQRELHIQREAIIETKPINSFGWIVDSSFSSQRLWGLTVRLDENVDLRASCVGRKVHLTLHDLEQLLADLTCLQCRMVLREWLCIEDGKMRVRGGEL